MNKGRMRSPRKHRKGLVRANKGLPTRRRHKHTYHCPCETCVEVKGKRKKHYDEGS